MSAVLKQEPESARDAVQRLFAGDLRNGFTIAGCHRWNAADGSELFRVVRLKSEAGDKTIRPIRRADGRYRLGKPERPAQGWPLYEPPYPLIETDPVFVSEGESCADSLARLGLTAFTSGSATSADGADWTPLKGRSVTVWPDHDAPGASYAADVARRLRALGCTVRVVNVAALGLPEHGDCVDWLAMHPGATADDVRALALVESPELARQRIIDAALVLAVDDPGALFEPEILDAIRATREDSPADYQRLRAKAKGLHASIGELDRLTLPVRAEKPADAPVRAFTFVNADGGGDESHAGEDDSLFPTVEPWAHPVEGAKLLDDVLDALQAHVIADKETLIAAALWAVHTWLLDELTVSPIAHISSPEKRCGKTVLLDALARLTCRPLGAGNISAAAVFRAVDLWKPTLLIDEADSFAKEDDALRGIVNGGLYRDSAFVIRCVGDDFTPTRFSTWGAKAIAGIGRLADTIEDRSIPLRMRRKMPGESVAKIRRSDPALWSRLQSQIMRWVADHAQAIGKADPVPIAGLNDRAQDCWEPLLAIADHAGSGWPTVARAAATTLHGVEDEAPGIGTELLAGIQAAFVEQGTTRLGSKELLAILCTDESAPWASWNRGKAMTERQLARKLDDYKIGPKEMRLPNGNRLRGYDVTAFRDAFRRYLPAQGDSIRDTVTSEQRRGFQPFSIHDANADCHGNDGPETAPLSHCHAVTDGSGEATSYSGEI